MEPALLARVSARRRMGPRRLATATAASPPTAAATATAEPARFPGIGSSNRSRWLLADQRCRSAGAVNNASTSQSASIGRFSTAAGTALAVPASRIARAAARAPRRLGFLYGAVSAPTPSVDCRAAVPTARPPRIGAAAALQLGHVNDCDAAVRNSSATSQRAAPSSAASLRHMGHFGGPLDGQPPRPTPRFERRVRAAARGRAEAGGARARGAATAAAGRRRSRADGAPFRADVGLSWGAPRYGFQQSLRGMAAASALRRRSLPVLKQGGDYAVAMRLRPDGRGKGGSDLDDAILRRCGTASAHRPTVRTTARRGWRRATHSPTPG